MGDVSKGDRVREWLKVFVPLVTAFIVVGIGGWISIFVANEIQRRAQERSNDIEVAKLAMEVLNEENPNLYSWLPELVETIKDSTMRDVISRGVIANPVVPDSVKQQVSSVEVTIKPPEFSLVKSEQDKKGEVKEKEITILDEPTCIIVYMEGAPSSHEKAAAIMEFLYSQWFICKVEPKSVHWYETYWMRDHPDSVRAAEIWFSTLVSEWKVQSYASRVKQALDSRPTLGKFEINEDATRRELPSNSILIVLPPGAL